MPSWGYFIFIATSVWCAWRFYSRRHQVPCPAWLSRAVEWNNPFAKAHKASAIIASLPLKKGIKILDIGCGPGRVLTPLAQKLSSVNGHVTGLDLQQKMLDKTSAKAKEKNLTNISLIKGDVSSLQLGTQYDCVLMACVLGEIPVNMQKTMLENLKGHLSPGGIISITETLFDPHFQSHKKVLKLMSSSGFQEIKLLGNRIAYTAHFIKDNEKGEQNAPLPL